MRLQPIIRLVRLTAARRTALLALTALSLGSPVAAEPPRGKEDEEEELAPAPMKLRSYDFGDMTIDGQLGVTPGGAQDIGYFRDRVSAGEVPHANTFRPEGLFSEHDLPLVEPSERCAELICVYGAATDAVLPAQPGVAWLAQLGFTSGIDAATFRRPPLNLVAVVDKSGSMSGAPIEVAKEGLLALSKNLGAEDRLTIVLYGDTTHVHLASTPGDQHQRIARAIEAIAIAGSTNLEAGLKLGFALAHASAGAAPGLTRVMLFTDERPNVGATDAESFMGLAQANSLAGIGLTTIGVGAQFGAELASKISSVRGGNLFFLASKEDAIRVFGEELDTLALELAYDMALELTPAPGFRVSALYGVPGEMLEWTEGGGLRFEVATLFASNKKGAIFAAFESAAGPGRPLPKTELGAAVGVARLSYSLRDGRRVDAAVELPWAPPASAPLGLLRGAALVDEATTLAAAAALHHERNDQDGAWRLVHDLARRMASSEALGVERERTLVEALEGTLARLAGRVGESPGK